MYAKEYISQQIRYGTKKDWKLHYSITTIGRQTRPVCHKAPYLNMYSNLSQHVLQYSVCVISCPLKIIVSAHLRLFGLIPAVAVKIAKSIA